MKRLFLAARHLASNREISADKAYKEATTYNDKANPVERRGRKATGPRFLRDAYRDAAKDIKTAGLSLTTVSGCAPFKHPYHR